MTKKGFIFLLIIIGIITYFNALFNGFVWDDEEQILNNTLIHTFSNFFQFFAGSTFNTGGGGLGGLYYKPLMTTFFSFIYTIFGANPFFFHLLQITLHIVNSIFVFLVFRYFFKHPKSDVISFILSLIFLVHSINTETVVYISSLQDILSFFFGIIAFWLVCSKSFISKKRYLLIFALLLCSLLSKETGILFVLILIVYVFLFLKKELVPSLITVFSSIAVYSFLRFAVAGIFFNKHGLTPISTLPFFDRLLSVPKVMYSYLKTFFYPIDLAINQHWVVRSADIPDFYIPLIFLFLVLFIAAGLLIFLRSKKSPYQNIYIFFLIWFIAGLIFHSHIIFPLDMTVSERWFYFPFIGLLGLFGTIFIQIHLNHLTKKILMSILIILITFLSIRTIIRNSNWKNGLSLYSHDILISTNTFDLENNFGVELFRVGRFDEAEKHFETSTRLAPNWWTNWNNLGAIMERKKDYKAAKIYYQKSIDNGHYYLAYQNLAKIYLNFDTPEATRNFVENSLKVLPNNAVLWVVLSISEYKLNDMDKALQAAKNAYSLDPNEQNAYIYQRLLQKLPLEIK